MIGRLVVLGAVVVPVLCRTGMALARYPTGRLALRLNVPYSTLRCICGRYFLLNSDLSVVYNPKVGDAPCSESLTIAPRRTHQRKPARVERS